MFGPDLVADQDAEIVAVGRVDTGSGDHGVGMLAQLVEHQRRNQCRPPLVHITHDQRAQVLPFGERLRDVRLWRALRHGRQHAEERKSQ
jgi:hypothetical protein